MQKKKIIVHTLHIGALVHYRFWSFKTRVTKLERFLHKNQTAGCPPPFLMTMRDHQK